MSPAPAITPSEQRFRTLFHALDARNEWNRFLTSAQLRYARVAAETPETWLPFLAGTPYRTHHGKDHEAGESSFSNDDVWAIAAIVRKRITFAAIDEDFFTQPCDDREDDHGLMPGDDGGYTDYDQLMREENALRKERSGVFRLYGYQGNDVTKIPKPLFAGRVRELLKLVKERCKDSETMKAIMRIVETEKRDGYGTVEECVAAVDGFIAGHRDALGENCKQVETMVADLRKEYEQFVKWFQDNVAENREMEGVLGVVMPRVGDVDESDSGRLGYDEACVEYRSNGDAPGVSVPKRPRVPVFGGNARRKSDGKSLWEMLGPSNAVVKNLGLYERVMKLKKEMYRLQDKKDGKIVKEEDKEEEVPKKETEIIEIGEEICEDKMSRERAMGESFVGLLLSHTGFSHVDERALECLTDVFEDFVGDIGRELISCRENIDNNAASVAEYKGRERRKSREELLMELELIMNCVKGGFAEIYNYVRADMMRTEQALREVEIRLKDRVGRLGGSVDDIVEEVVDGSNFVDEGDIDFDGEQLAFGYLGKRVWLDVLDGVRVPVEMVYGNVKEEVELMATDT